MKKAIATSVIFFAFVMGFAQQHLPIEANNVIETYFPQSTLNSVSKYDAPSEFAYRADLDSDIILYFDANGRWVAAESFSSDISQLLSAQVKASMEAQNTLPKHAVKIRRNDDGTLKVVYNDGLALLFAANGDFLREVER